MSSLYSFLSLGVLAALVAWLEVPKLRRAGQVGELWAFIAFSSVAFTLLTLVSASVSFAGMDDAIIEYIKPILDPLIQGPPQ